MGMGIGIWSIYIESIVRSSQLSTRQVGRYLSKLVVRSPISTSLDRGVITYR